MEYPIPDALADKFDHMSSLYIVFQALIGKIGGWLWYYRIKKLAIKSYTLRRRCWREFYTLYPDAGENLVYKLGIVEEQHELKEKV